jgi:hypothetical protein
MGVTAARTARSTPVLTTSVLLIARSRPPLQSALEGIEPSRRPQPFIQPHAVTLGSPSRAGGLTEMRSLRS